MSFTEEERAIWHAARKAGLNPSEYDPDDLKDELERLKLPENDDDTDDGEAVVGSTECAHCGHSLGGETSYSEFPLCRACDD